VDKHGYARFVNYTDSTLTMDWIHQSLIFLLETMTF